MTMTTTTMGRGVCRRLSFLCRGRTTTTVVTDTMCRSLGGCTGSSTHPPLRCSLLLLSSSTQQGRRSLGTSAREGLSMAIISRNNKNNNNKKTTIHHDSSNNNKNNNERWFSSMATTAAMAVGMTAAAATAAATTLVSWEDGSTAATSNALMMMMTTHCDAASSNKTTTTTKGQQQQDDTTTTTSEITDITPPNPLWPCGVDSKQVDLLVEDCLKDPSINIQAIPDYMERQLYRSTIQLTLNMIYYFLGQVHGTSILAHEVQLRRLPLISTLSKENNKKNELVLSQLRNDLDEQVLEEMADKLLSNKAVNQTLIPDVLERQIYKNCLKIVFRLLDLLSATLAVSVCGHDFRLSIESSQRKALLTQEGQKVIQEIITTNNGNGKNTTTNQHNKKNNKICTPIDTVLLLQYAAQEAGIDMEYEHANQSWWSRLLFQSSSSLSQEFTMQLHASLYSLILGLLDDLFDQTTIILLNDGIQLDLIPVPEHIRLQRQEQQEQEQQEKALEEEISKKEKGSSSSSNGYLPLAGFTMGVGVGLCLMTVVQEYKRFL